MTRQIVLGVGAALLVGGWGATRYAIQSYEAFRETYQTVVSQVWSHWQEHDRPIFIRGIISMTVGAGLIGVALLKPQPPTTG